MPVEKITQVSQTKPWLGGLAPRAGEPLLYGLYTHGIAGERFFREIKDNGKFVGTRCPKCNLIYLPPRIYCERCFNGLEEWVEIPNRGIVYTFTAAYVDLDDNRLEKPVIIALIRFDGIHGGLIHKLGEVEPGKVNFGMKVEAVFKEKEKREGNILDIEYFRPI